MIGRTFKQEFLLSTFDYFFFKEKKKLDMSINQIVKEKKKKLF
jgi:hypothetical protein